MLRNMNRQDNSSKLIGKNVEVVVASLEIGLLSPYFSEETEKDHEKVSVMVNCLRAEF